MKSPPLKAWSGPAATPTDPYLDGCRSGRPEAIEQLFRAHRPMVERMIARLVGPSPDFEDLVQSTFVEVIRNLGRFRGRPSSAPGSAASPSTSPSTTCAPAR